MIESAQVNQAFVQLNNEMNKKSNYNSVQKKNAVYHTDSQGGEAFEKDDVANVIVTTENAFQSNQTKKMYMEDGFEGS